MSKYEILVNILDQLLYEAPARHVSYHPAETNTQAVEQARAKAYVHLFLKVKFGLLTFDERERQMTEGTQDGGIDAYFIDYSNRIIYFIQSKFRTSAETFQEREISIDDLLHMVVGRITRGETTDIHGVPYNGRMQRLIREISEIVGIAQYNYKIILLANIRNIVRENLERIVGKYEYEVIDFNRCYDELVFPVISGTYYNASDLFIDIHLSPREFTAPRIRYYVTTNYAECEITALFVPTIEIAKIMLKYKNSILKYNPRSYLSLKNNDVNQEIALTITQLRTNEFALYNNGITMLSDGIRFTEETGRQLTGQVHIKSPQIINGGQTAYTLSHIYESVLARELAEDVFEGKEVLLKVIAFVEAGVVDEAAKLRVIEQISKATNQQTPVEEADRRSNDLIQVELQRAFYRNFGFFYERKAGEFFDGLTKHYIKSDVVLGREQLLRIAYALIGQPARARGAGSKSLFSPDSMDQVFNDETDINLLFFGYRCVQQLDAIQARYRWDRNNPYGILNYGSALRYGRYAVTSAAATTLTEPITPQNVTQLAVQRVVAVLDQWLGFEEFARQQPTNRQYFPVVFDPLKNEEHIEPDYNGYYKGRTLNADLIAYFNPVAEAHG